MMLDIDIHDNYNINRLNTQLLYNNSHMCEQITISYNNINYEH